MTTIHPDARPANTGQRAGRRYLNIARELLTRLADDQWPEIARAADTVASALISGRRVHAFGTGHSHMLVEEMYYRAGGLVRIEPILFDGLMLHHSTARSTSLERLPGLAAALLADHSIGSGDVVLIASNSGGNAAVVEMAREASSAGALVIAVTSIAHATSAAARATNAPRLHTVANIVIDNGGAPGDAAIEIDGLDRKVAPTSTVVGAAVVNAIVAEAAQLMVERGHVPEVYESLNTQTGDAEHERERVGLRGEGSRR